MTRATTVAKRRTHTKSRQGCNSCKRRKIKCSEEKPSCRDCNRRSILCVYTPVVPRSRIAPAPNETASLTPTQDPSPSVHNGTASLTPTLGPSPSSLAVPVVSSPRADACQPLEDLSSWTNSPGLVSEHGSFDVQDLALLHHWTVATSLTLVNDSSIDHIWQSTVVRLAFRHPYVLQSILSVTALHLAYQQPAERSSLSAKAAQYHNRALGDFQASIDQICRENSDALFATAVINIFYTFALFGVVHEKDTSESAVTERARILGKDWIPLIRGVMALLKVIRQHVDEGPLSSMLSLGNWLELDPDVNATPEDEKFQLLRATWVDTSDASVYDETLHVLRKCWAWMAQFQHPTSQLAQGLLTNPHWAYNRSYSGPFIWLSLAPDLFFTRLQQRQPQALLLFAHFGILADQVGRYWWMKGWGRNIVRVVDDIIGEYWKQYMALPLRAVGLIDDTHAEQD